MGGPPPIVNMVPPPPSMLCTHLQMMAQDLNSLADKSTYPNSQCAMDMTELTLQLTVGHVKVGEQVVGGGPQLAEVESQTPCTQHCLVNLCMRQCECTYQGNQVTI
uniref:Uncharacterized protein n=1 Tax=Eutreptiella gymnastica TaxID=73025 RepID=A0A7S1III9_9EUGL|mmetsp:Transcript_21035/g.37641  ORF Transcript_21035/g.37641 Transcript_21035/m.37641 type:complete len:106 (+) Transcript_21035:134-451(+)